MTQKVQHINETPKHISATSNLSSLKTLTVSVILPVHKPGPELRACLHALSAHASKVHEIILVLDGFKLSKGFLKQFTLPNHKTVWLETNKGPAFARNHGASKASGNLLFFIDSDVEIASCTIDRVLTHFQKETSCDGLIGSYDDQPEENSLISRYRNLLHHYIHQQAQEEATTFWGACGAIRKEAFDAIGGFNPSFTKPSVEDIELGYRLIHRGYSIMLNKSLLVKHHKKWTLFNMARTDIFLRARPWTRLLYHYEKLGVNDLNISYKERLSVILLTIGILSLILSLKWSFLMVVGLTSLFSLILVKKNIYQFFSRHFKWYQMPGVVLLHWVYLICALVGFILGTIDRFSSLKKTKSRINSDDSTCKDKRLVLNE